MLNLVQQAIIERSKRPHYSGKLEKPTASQDGLNASCGDEVHFEVLIKNGLFKQIRHTTRACSICAASADLLAEYLEDKPLNTLQSLKETDITEWLGIPLSPARQKCALLPLETLLKTNLS